MATRSISAEQKDVAFQEIVKDARYGRHELCVQSQILEQKLKLRLYDGNKRYLFKQCCPQGEHDLDGTLTFSRWKCLNLRSSDFLFLGTDKIPTYEMKEDSFTYNESRSREVDFTINFADKSLFGFYGGSLFAQDEMQVAEHPSLGILREYLLKAEDSKIKPSCRDRNNRPTPCVIMGAKRLCSISTDRNASEGRPHGLYGNYFGYASKDAIKQAAHVFKNPTTTNIIAMVAPAYGKGDYTKSQIYDILETAYSTFVAARIEAYIKKSYLKDDGEVIDPEMTKPKVVIHTGNWGTGAFGGNKIMMAILQLVSARIAEVDRLVYHTFSPEYSEAYKKALSWMESFLPPTSTDYPKMTLEKLIQEILDLHLQWGVSDGN